MTILFVAIYITWFLSEFLINRLFHSTGSDKAGKDKSSLSFLWITIAVAMTIAGFVQGNVYAPISSNQNIRYAGLALIVIGIVCRALVIKSLGKFFTVDVTIRKDHSLKTDGIYKILRHPSYSFSLLSFFGFGLSVNNWISLLIAFVPVFIAFTMRIKIEEAALTENFGDEYLQYKKHTSALIPFIF